MLTAALSPTEQQVFLDRGFTVHEHLHLLRHPLGAPIARASAPAVAVGAATSPEVLDVDRQAFDPFWRFDLAGLDDARRATPSVALPRDRQTARSTATR